MQASKRHRWLHVLVVSALGLVVIYHFFFISRYTKLPWFARLASDLECTYTTNTLTFVNDLGPPTHVFYPSATNFMIYGVMHRIIGSVHPDYKPILQFDQIEQFSDIFPIMDQSNKLCRYATLLIMLAFVILMYALMYTLTKNILISFGSILFLITSRLVIIYNYMLRPELLSLMFLLLAILKTFYLFKKGAIKPGRYVRYFLLVGLLIGLSVFSKIQILTLVLWFLICLFYSWIWQRGETHDLKLSKNNANLNLIVMILIWCVFPWWAVIRPEHITPRLIGDPLDWPFRMLYGPPPGRDHWLHIPAVMFILMSIPAIWTWLVSHQKQISERLQVLFKISYAINWLTLGFILSIYLLCLFISPSFKNYWISTQTIVYATMCNIFKGGFLENPTVGLNNLKQIYLNLKSIEFSFLNMFWLLSGGVALSIFRIVTTRTKANSAYVHALVWIVGGLLMDFSSTLREADLKWWYVIYSLCPYVIGLTIIVHEEIKQYKTTIRSVAFMSCTALLMIHLGTVVHKHNIKTAELSSLSYERANYYEEFRGCSYQANAFWEFINRTMYNSKEFEITKTYGQQAAFGKELKEVAFRMEVLERMRNKDHEKYKFGALDDFIQNYTITQKIKAYFYNYFQVESQKAYDQSDYAIALQHINEAINLQPYFPESYLYRSRIYGRQKNYEDSLADAKTALRLGLIVQQNYIQSLEDKIR